MTLKKNLIIFFILSIIIILLNSEESVLNKKMPIIIDSDVIINIVEISNNALFFPVKIDDVLMEILVVKAPDETIRTAFNTCQVCYTSGQGYFLQENTYLVCQNCKRRFRMSQVEIESGGCTPLPILAENKIISDNQIIISKNFLSENKEWFLLWKN
jgi:uncharacterized membrane protein